ncbi:acyltransferase family protein [Blautia sp.]
MKNRCIDFYKCVASILIIFIHCRFPGEFGKIVVVFARPAVLYFFLVAGFFCYYEKKVSFLKKMKKKIIRLIRTTGIVLGLYFIWECILRIFGSSSNLKAYFVQVLLRKENIVKVLIFQEDILVGPFWFLFALVLCYLFALIAGRKNIQHMYWIIPVLLSINIIISEILPVFGKSINIIYYRNFIFTGLPFFLMGYWIHDVQYSNLLKNVLPLSATHGIILGAALSLLEYVIFGNSLIYLGSVIIAIYCLVDAISNPRKGNKYGVLIGKKYSMTIYYMHWFIIDVVSILGKHTKILEKKWYGYILPVIVVIITIISSIMLDYLKKKVNFDEKNTKKIIS